MCSDTFGVGVRVTEEELRFLVHVPTDIDSGWTDPETFQSLVAEVVWERLDRRSVLETIATEYDTGDTVTLGTVTLDPDGSVVGHDLTDPRRSDEEG
ncbi:hypothetical protein [Halorubrum cibi]|uniref:DUF8124 domain-containing protein n=1 Tax=Halorubrum cibi TaxID=413815 RepID=A0A521EZJ6_9EURY|nr:hypothetical protein [Halorubrum cibi]SMO89315.1 hypothetical protein SAMN06264867_1142 [Halorubrum cibi]